jgi:prevent-host-death family protein
MGMKIVNIHEAKTHLSRLLKRAAAGEDVVIARAGRPIARLVPVGPLMGERVLGSQKGKFIVPEDFDAPLPEEILAEFER